MAFGGLSNPRFCVLLSPALTGAAAYDQHYKQRVMRNLQRRAAKLGMRLEPTQTNPV